MSKTLPSPDAPTTVIDMSSKSPRMLFSSSTIASRNLAGPSGRRYVFKELIQQRPHVGSVWLAEADEDRYLLKDMPESYFLNFTEDIWPRLGEHSHYIRLPCDSISGHRILVYPYLSHDFMDLVKKDVPLRSRKIILKSVLRGLTELHDAGIVHLDVKPDNVVADFRGDPTSSDGIIEKVQVADFENAAWVPTGKNVEGMLAGNENWRSPEAHLRAKLNTPTDIFSFAVMCIYAMLGRVIFGRDKDFEYHESQGIIPQLIRLQRQISYFGDEEGFRGLVRHVSHNKKICEVITAMWEDRNEPNIPYRHFSTWPEIEDAEFRDVVLKMTSLNPSSRISAQQALQHPWFAKISAV